LWLNLDSCKRGTDGDVGDRRVDAKTREGFDQDARFLFRRVLIVVLLYPGFVEQLHRRCVILSVAFDDLRRVLFLFDGFIDRLFNWLAFSAG
jgi:hypothetical protein